MRPEADTTVLGTSAAAQCWWGRKNEERLLTKHHEWDDVERLC
jgi:hypothetical protein